MPRILLFACLLIPVFLRVPIASGVEVAPGDEPPVKVFILAGQSNMEGHGMVASDPDRNGGRGSLEWLVDRGPERARYRHLRDEQGGWRSRDDVKVWYLGRQGDLRPGFGAREDRIGPELGFGHVVGDAYDAPVVLLKIAWGGKAIGKEFRPPSAGGEVGPEYRMLVAEARKALASIGTLFPEFKGRETELVGLGWHQGWNDRVNQAFNDEYEKNLGYFIRDVRQALGTPRLPVVIAETGMNGPDEKHPRALSLMAAQRAVAESPEFRETVAFVPTQSLWRDRSESPSGQGYHWNSNAETYYLIGDGMGRAMLELVDAP